MSAGLKALSRLSAGTQATLDKNYKKLPIYALKYAKHTSDHDVKNMVGGGSVTFDDTEEKNLVLKVMFLKSSGINIGKKYKEYYDEYICITSSNI